MSIRNDIQQNNNAVVISNNDIIWGPSDEQHIIDNIYAFPGYYKENPADGVGVFSYLKSSGKKQQLIKSIKLNLTSDGYNANNPMVSFDANGELDINPDASR